jgi:hypothetical protein
MDRAGIAGYQLFDAARTTPQIVPERQPYMSPAWKHAFSYASRLAAKHRLEQTIASSPGWSISGGPWVKPADGMNKKVPQAVKARDCVRSPGTGTLQADDSARQKR